MFNLKNKILSITVIVYFSLSVFCICLANTPDEEVIAVIGNHKIKFNDFVERYEDYLLVSDMKDNIRIRKAILSNMLNEILLHYYDDNTKLYNSAEFKKENEWNKKQAVLAYLKDREIFAKITVTEQELKEAFLKVNEKISARHLFAETEKEAYELYDLLKIGKSFEELAVTVFSDSVLRNNGGYLGYFTWGDMYPSFEEAAYSLKAGDISEPVKTAYGYSIIKVEDKVRVPILTENEFLNKKSHLTRTLKIRKKKPAERAYINNIYNKNSLQVDEEAIPFLLEVLKKSNNSKIDVETNFHEDKVCVIYKNKNYTLGEIKEKLTDIPSYHLNRINSVEDIRPAVESVFIQEELLQNALDKGYDTLTTVTDMITKLKNNSFLKFKKEEILYNASIPDSLVMEYYKNNIHRFSSPKMINIQEILVQKKSLADSLFSLIKGGEDFGKLASNFSLRKWTAENEGVFGLTPIDKFGMFKDKFWEAGENSLIGPVQIEDLYGIFKVLAKVDSEPIVLDKIKDRVEEEAKSEFEVKIFADYLDKIQSKVEININEELLSSYQFLNISLK